MFYNSINEYQNDDNNIACDDDHMTMQIFDHQYRELIANNYYIFVHEVNFVRVMQFAKLIERIVDEFDNTLHVVDDARGDRKYVDINRLQNLQIYELNVEFDNARDNTIDDALTNDDIDKLQKTQTMMQNANETLLHQSTLCDVIEMLNDEQNETHNYIKNVIYLCENDDEKIVQQLRDDAILLNDDIDDIIIKTIVMLFDETSHNDDDDIAYVAIDIFTQRCQRAIDDRDYENAIKHYNTCFDKYDARIIDINIDDINALKNVDVS